MELNTADRNLNRLGAGDCPRCGKLIGVYGDGTLESHSVWRGKSLVPCQAQSKTAKAKVKVSKAARRELLDRVYLTPLHFNEPPMYWFGYGDNAAIRELIDAGYVDWVQIRWSATLVVTRAGGEYASQLRAEQERQEAGIDIREFKLLPLIPLHKLGWVAAEVQPGVWLHTDGKMMARGQAANSVIPGAEHFNEAKLRDVFERYTGDAPGESCTAMSAELSVLRTREEWFIRFDNGRLMQGRYYSHVLRLFPETTWKFQDQFYAVSGDVVAVVMPLRD